MIKGTARMRYSNFILALLAVAIWTTPAFSQRRNQADAVPDAFRFRFFGPAVGNRIASVAGIPGDPSTYYAGAASGGIFKSTDGGNAWLPIFDSRIRNVLQHSPEKLYLKAIRQYEIIS